MISGIFNYRKWSLDHYCIMLIQHKADWGTQRPKSAVSAAVVRASHSVGFEVPVRLPETEAETQPKSNCFVAETDRGFCRNPHDQADGFYA